MTDHLKDLSTDELAAVVDRRRRNEAHVASLSTGQRAVAQSLLDSVRDEYDSAYLLPCAGRYGYSDELAVSGYKGSPITQVAECRVYSDGRTEECHYRVKDLGPDGFGGRRTKHVAIPGRCLCRLSV